MSRRDQGKAHTYSYYDLESGMTYLGSSGQPGESLAAAICIPAGELPENGGILTSVSLHPHGTAARGYYLIVEQGDERLLTEEFTPEVDLPDFKFQVLELEAFDVNVKGGEDLFVGYAVAEAESGFPFTISSDSMGAPAAVVPSMGTLMTVPLSGVVLLRSAMPLGRLSAVLIMFFFSRARRWS